MGGVHNKDQMLQMYLVERNRMNKWYIKLFRRLSSAKALNSLITYGRNLGQKVDHFKFRIYLIEELLVRYSMQHKVSDQEGRTTLQ
jgi:hypothetical protein